LKKFNGTTWVIVGPGHFATGYLSGKSMVLSDTGIPIIAYTDNSYKVVVRKYETSSWTTIGTDGLVHSSSSYPPSVAINSSGVPYIAYMDKLNNDKITVKHYNGSEWQLVGKPGFSNSPAYGTIIKFKPDNTPIAGYSNGGFVVAELKTGPITPVTGTMSVCTGATVYLDNKTLGGSWSSSNTSVAIASDGASVSGFTAGTSVISYIVNNECGTALASTTVTVNGGAAVLSGPSQTCTGTSIVLIPSEAGGYWYSEQPWVAMVDDTGTVTGVSTGTAVIYYSTTPGSCGGYVSTRVVTVNEAVSAGSITGIPILCAEASTMLYNDVTGGTWSSSDTGIATIDVDGNVTGLNGGTTVVSYIVASPGCGNITTTQEVTVNALPSAGTIIGMANVCVGSSITLGSTTSGGSWSSNNGEIATVDVSGIVTGNTAGTVTISYTVAGECGTNTTTQIVTVNSAPSAGIITGTASVCVGSTSVKLIL
jgi:uncharacterized protein YjdB